MHIHVCIKYIYIYATHICNYTVYNVDKTLNDGVYLYVYIHPCKLHLRQHLRHHVRILCVILPQICLICLWPPAMETSNHLRKCVFHGTLLELVGRVPVASMKIVSSCDWSRRPQAMLIVWRKGDFFTTRWVVVQLLFASLVGFRCPGFWNDIKSGRSQCRFGIPKATIKLSWVGRLWRKFNVHVRKFLWVKQNL